MTRFIPGNQRIWFFINKKFEEIIVRVILILATVTRALTALQKRQSSKIRQAIIARLNQIWHVSVIASACAIARYLFIYLPLTELKVYNKNHLHSISYTNQWWRSYANKSQWKQKNLQVKTKYNGWKNKLRIKFKNFSE